MSKKTLRVGYKQARKGLYYELTDFHNNIDKKMYSFNEACQSSSVYRKIAEKHNDYLDLSEEELLKILEDDVAKPKKESEVVEVKEIVTETVKETPTATKYVAHDLIYDKTLKKWLHIKVEYDMSMADIEVVGVNQAVAMKKVQDLFMNKAIKERKS